jgi:hypothetical protein
MPLTGQVVRVEDISSPRRDEMFGLMSRNYEFLTRDEFDRDLDEKTWAIVVADGATDALCGFSTQTLFDVDACGRPVRALFSGDTIVDPAYWHRNPLAGLWGRLALSIIDQNPHGELYWYLISKGYKTYRFLPTFFHTFYPRFDVNTPGRAGDVLDALGRHRYPASYDSQAGIVRAGARGCRLRSGLAEVTPEKLRDPHVHYFHRRNPRHATGDELCCIAPLTRENFRRAAWKVIGSVETEVRDPRSEVSKGRSAACSFLTSDF